MGPASSNEFISRLDGAANKAGHELLSHRNSHGHWEGELSSSALSTATAACALAMACSNSSGQSADLMERAGSGLKWLAQHQNSDGGWGDTTISLSNISTTALCWAAYGTVPGADETFRPVLRKTEDWLARKARSIDPDVLAPAIIRRYGKDRTFSVPILTMCALAGRLGFGRAAWKWVIPLPFELAAFPHRFYAALRLPVVSYALPALIAIGYARHYHRPSWNPIIRYLRAALRSRTLRVLTRIQPSSGGFLEATPLTSFVVMSLASSGLSEHTVTRKGIEFLVRSMRSDGSWPIDTNLATWVTTLSTNALLESPFEETVGSAPETRSSSTGFKGDEYSVIRDWLLGQQFLAEHPYTHAPPGAWAWTDLPGGVPDSDDTAGALLALRKLGVPDSEVVSAARNGIQWLLNLQNRDGGIPTFCRGWGALPFDRSAPDLTAHAIRAWLAWMDQFPDAMRSKIEKAIHKAVLYLSRTQRKDGSWVPLWFGNQFAPDDENPTYGTSRVLCALAEFDFSRTRDGTALSSEKLPLLEPILSKATSNAALWLISCQHSDGCWGGVPGGTASVEETALASEALAALLDHSRDSMSLEIESAIGQAATKGVTWLIEKIENGTWQKPSPIGFYFAKLWYFERLYPMIFTAAALNRLRRHRSQIHLP